MEPGENADEEIRAQNDARRQFLASQGIKVPIEQMYLVSLLEFLLTEDIDEARAFHERRIAPILESAIGKLGDVQEQVRSEQARATLLQPL